MIRADAVHPGGDRSDLAGHFEALGDDLIVAENAVDHADFRMHVAEPDEAVALDTTHGARC